MGSEVTDVIEDLRLIKHTLEFVRTPKEVKEYNDLELEYYKVYQYTEVLFSKIQGLIATLEGIGGTLYSIDELEELKGFIDSKYLIKDIERLEVIHDDTLFEKFGK